MEQMGGFLMGNSHARGGVPGVVNGKQPIEMEGGEYVINKEAAQILGPSLLSRLNNVDKVDYQEGGEVEDIIPAGRNIFGQPTEAMTQEELFEMIMPGGGAGLTFKTVKMMAKAEKLLQKGKQGMTVPGHSGGFLEFPKYTFESNKTVLNSINSLKNAIKEREKMATFYKSIGKPLGKSRSMQLWSDKKKLEALEDFYTMPNKQQGGYIDEYQEGGYTNNADMGIDDEIPSLLELSLPILSNRLQKYTHGGPISPTTPGGPGGMYAELGYEEPDSYLEYQPMIMPYSFLGEQASRSRAMGSLQYTPEGKGGFGKTGFGGVLGSEAEKKRLEAQSGLYHNIAGQRQDYLTDWASALYQDISSGDFTPTLLGTNGDNSDNGESCFRTCDSRHAPGGQRQACYDSCSGTGDSGTGDSGTGDSGTETGETGTSDFTDESCFRDCDEYYAPGGQRQACYDAC